MSAPASNTCIVTGGAGFIGSHVTDCILAQGGDVVVVDNLASGKRERVNDAATFYEADVTDAGAMQRIARAHAPAHWFHLAAQADVRVSVDDPVADAQTNVLGTICVLEAARLTGAQVVFASTGGAIYGDADVIPTPEGSPEEPLAPYGAAKLAAEKYVGTHARLYGLQHAVVRYANVYGPRQDPHGEAGVVAIFAGRIAAGMQATVNGDGSQTRDYVYVDDVVEATLAAARIDPHTVRGVPTLNVGTGVETSVLELWQRMQQAAGVDLGLAHAPARLGELERSALDASLARQLLGVAIATPLDEGLARTLAWMQITTPAE